ncbi:MAG: Fe-S-binding domain-containing protein, partial [Balneolaceae bacterium]
MIFMIWIGIHPVDFTKYSEVQVTELIEASEAKSIAVLENASTDDLPDWTARLYKVDKVESQLVSK